MSTVLALLEVRLVTHVHATEDQGKVHQALRNLCPPGFPDPKIKSAKGHYGNEIRTLELKSPNRKIAQDLLRNLWTRLSSSDQSLILDELSQYMDESGHLFLRVDKQLAYHGRVELRQTESIRIEFTFQSRNLKKQDVLDLVRERIDLLESER